MWSQAPLPTAPDNEMRFGSKCWLNAVRILPKKLMSSTPGHPKVLRSAKISLMP
jgi:hypothetical protein